MERRRGLPAAVPGPTGLQLGPGIFASPDDDLALKPLIRGLLKRKTKGERVLRFFTKWGRNGGPFGIAYVQVRLHWKGVDYWLDVRKAAQKGRDLVARVDGLERGARALKKAADELSRADDKLPNYPLKTGDDYFWVSGAELDYVDRYFNSAARVANEAMATRAELNKAIAGWDAVLKQADGTKDFTRAVVWGAINDLDLRFSNEGGSFRAYLVEARDTADLVESWARKKQYHAAHILGKWTPDWYVPPTPE
jgi:hypothetical protein